MSDLLLFCLAVVGMTFIVVHGKIYETPRSWLTRFSWLSSLVTCYQCFGFWCGCFLGLILFPFSLATIFACGCAGSFLASFFHSVSEWIVSRTDFGE